MTAPPLRDACSLRPETFDSAFAPPSIDGSTIDRAVSGAVGAGLGDEEGEAEEDQSELEVLLQLELQRLRGRLGGELRRREQELQELIQELRTQNLTLRAREQALPIMPGAVEDLSTAVDEPLMRLPSKPPPTLTVPVSPGKRVASKKPPARQCSSKMFRLLPAWRLEAANLADSRIVDGMSRNAISSCSITRRHTAEFAQSQEDEQRQRTRSWTIAPSSRAFLTWNGWFVLVLGFELLMFPMAVFDIPNNRFLETMSWVTLVFWTVDVMLSFSIGYYNNQGNLVLDRKLIASHYMRTWGIPDIAIVLCDWLALLIDPRGKGAATLMRVGKALKYIRLLRIVRLHKLHAAFRRFDDVINSQFFSIIKRFVMNIVGILVISHYVGCVWYLIGTIGDEETSWVRRYYKLVEGEEEQWKWGYLTALHWSMTQFTPGSMDVQPQNSYERIYAVGVLVLGMIFFSTIVSSITGATASLKSLSAEHARQVWLLRRYFNEQGISTDLLARVMVYTAGVVRQRQKFVLRQNVKLLDILSDSLQQEVTLEMYSRHLVVHPFFLTFSRISRTVFSKVCHEALSRLSFSGVDVVFSPGQEAQNMYFLVEGQLSYQTLLLSDASEDERTGCDVMKGTAFCEPVLWTAWVHQGLMLAEVDSEIIALDAHKFRKVLAFHRGDMWFAIQYGQEFVKRMNSEAGFFTDTLSDDRSLSDLFEIGSIPKSIVDAATRSTSS